MVNFEATIKNFFKNHDIDIDHQRVVIGVSTGVDSMVLLDLMTKYTNALVTIAHVNHGKRSASIAEEEYICSYAKENNLDCFVYHIKKEEIKDGNFQEEARNIRYRFFKDIMINQKAPILLLAHHLNDDIETILFRLNRGASLAGYAGISDIVKIEEGIIARPLLGILKKDIIDYAKANDIKYYEDESNATDIYSRNQIRHNDVPEIFNTIDTAAKDFIEMKNNIKNASIVLDEYRDNLIKAFVKKDENGYSFKKSDFLKIHEYIQKQIIFELTKKQSLSSKNVDEILKIINSNKANIVTKIGSLQVIKSYDEVCLYSKFIAGEKNIIKICINDLKNLEYNVGSVGIKINHIDEDCCKVPSRNCYLMSYDYNMLPLVIRTWEDGDEIKTASGTKKVSRILIDNHVSLLKRNKVLVVCKDEDILMVVGYQKSLQSLKKYTTLDKCNMMIEFKEED